MMGPTATSGQADVVNRLFTADENDNKLNEWVAADACSATAQVTVNAASSSTAGVSSDWSHTVTPMNIDQTNANGTFKFKVNQTLPKGSLITVKYPSNLTNSLSNVSGNDLKDYCWSTQQYTKCESVTASSIKLTTAVDITSSTSIEVWLDDGFSTSSTAAISTTGFDITATWQGISIISDPDTAASYTAGSQFTPTAAIGGSITDDSVSMYANNPGASSDYTFSFKVTGGYTVGDKIMIKFPREFDLFVGDAG